MHVVAGVCIYLAAHFIGAIDVAAQYLGPVGTVISTVDKGVTDTVNIKNYVATRKVARKKVVSK